MGIVKVETVGKKRDGMVFMTFIKSFMMPLNAENDILDSHY